MSDFAPPPFVLLMLVAAAICECIVVYQAWRLARKSGKSFKSIMRYSMTAWQMDIGTRYKHIAQHPVSKQNILAEVNYIQRLQFKLGIAAIALFSVALLIHHYHPDIFPNGGTDDPFTWGIEWTFSF